MSERPALARVLPFAIYMAFLVVDDVLGRLGWGADSLRWLYAVKVGAVALALLAWRRHYQELAVPRPGAGALALAAASGLLVLVLWLNLNAPWMLLSSSKGFDPRNHGILDWGLVSVRLLGAALVVPVMEELFWRSFLLRWLQSPQFLSVAPASVRLVWLAVNSLLFGIEHSQWLAGVVAGLAYGVLYMRSGNIWSPIAAHAVTNGALGCWIISTGQWTYW